MSSFSISVFFKLNTEASTLFRRCNNKISSGKNKHLLLSVTLKINSFIANWETMNLSDNDFIPSTRSVYSPRLRIVKLY